MTVREPTAHQPDLGVVGLGAEVADRVADRETPCARDEIPVGLTLAEERLTRRELGGDVETLEEEVSGVGGELGGAGTAACGAIAEGAEEAVGDLDRTADIGLSARGDPVAGDDQVDPRLMREFVDLGALESAREEVPG
jgi:hypothetical protein